MAQPLPKLSQIVKEGQTSVTLLTQAQEPPTRHLFFKLHPRKAKEQDAGSARPKAVTSAEWSCHTSHTILMSSVWICARFWRWALTMRRRLPCSVNWDQVKSCSSAQVMGTRTSR